MSFMSHEELEFARACNGLLDLIIDYCFINGIKEDHDEYSDAFYYIVYECWSKSAEYEKFKNEFGKEFIEEVIEYCY